MHHSSVSHRPFDPVASYRISAISSNFPTKHMRLRCLRFQRGRVSLSYWGASWPHFHCKAFLTFQCCRRFEGLQCRHYSERLGWLNAAHHLCELIVVVWDLKCGNCSTVGAFDVRNDSMRVPGVVEEVGRLKPVEMKCVEREVKTREQTTDNRIQGLRKCATI